jgi:hypothetical protein
MWLDKRGDFPSLPHRCEVNFNPREEERTDEIEYLSELRHIVDAAERKADGIGAGIRDWQR